MYAEHSPNHRPRALLFLPEGIAREWLPAFTSPEFPAKVSLHRIGDDPDPDTRYALGIPRQDQLLKMPKLRAVFALSAGVDQMLVDGWKVDAPLVRLSHPSVAQQLASYCVMRALGHLRNTVELDARQRNRIWSQNEPGMRTADTSVGILGMGASGSLIADTLRNLGMRVVGWTRSGRRIGGIPTECGSEGLLKLLSSSGIMICTLPLTDETRGILDREAIGAMKFGCYFINVGWGKIVDEAALVQALQERRLSGAALDVFATEPLPPENPLWTLGGVSITAHHAAIIAPQDAADAIAKGMADDIAGRLPPDDVVSPERGY
ncbi:MAG: NAD(P)-dependent oxidoreductase [Novosphingobium sp.]